MRLVLEFKLIREDGSVVGGYHDMLRDMAPKRVKYAIDELQFRALNMLESATDTPANVLNANATAAGMTRLLDGKDVKDTVK